MSDNRESFGLIVLTIIAAILLSMLPLPAFIETFKPYWVALVMIYWSLETRSSISLGLAFLVGILVDIFSGSLLGLHALSLVVMVFLVQRFRSRIRFFPPWQQALSILGLLVNDRIILIWIGALLGEPLPTLSYWLPPLIGMAFWPWLFLLLDSLRANARRSKT